MLLIELPDLNDKKGFVSLLMQEGLSQAEAEDAFYLLKEVYKKYQTAFDGLIRKLQAEPPHYKIVKTDGGPQISHSRVMVYDVLDYLNQGEAPEEIAQILNLHPHQVDVALEYIEQHRAVLEAELLEIKARMAKEETKYRTIQREIRLKARTLPMTAEKKAFYEFLETDKRNQEQASGNSTE